MTKPVRTVSLATFSLGRLLIVKSRKHNVWTLPGGKIEEGESEIGALRRECMEELCVKLAGVRLLKDFSGVGPTSGLQITTAVFTAKTKGVIVPSDEIEQYTWIDKGESKGDENFPLSDVTNQIVKFLSKKRLL